MFENITIRVKHSGCFKLRIKKTRVNLKILYMFFTDLIHEHLKIIFQIPVKIYLKIMSFLKLKTFSKITTADCEVL